MLTGCESPVTLTINKMKAKRVIMTDGQRVEAIMATLRGRRTGLMNFLDENKWQNKDVKGQLKELNELITIFTSKDF
tara:strand:+ start:1857 stop:2087 length:231 start_codon:yes stop_codon:yes gene_type:complete